MPVKSQKLISRISTISNREKGFTKNRVSCTFLKLKIFNSLNVSSSSGLNGARLAKYFTRRWSSATSATFICTGGAKTTIPKESPGRPKRTKSWGSRSPYTVRRTGKKFAWPFPIESTGSAENAGSTSCAHRHTCHRQETRGGCGLRRKIGWSCHYTGSMAHVGRILPSRYLAAATIRWRIAFTRISVRDFRWATKETVVWVLPQPPVRWRDLSRSSAIRRVVRQLINHFYSRKMNRTWERQLNPHLTWWQTSSMSVTSRIQSIIKKSLTSRRGAIFSWVEVKIASIMSPLNKNKMPHSS